MVCCRTNVTNNMIQSLAKYHLKHKKNAKRNRVISISWSIVLLLISLINAYGHWMKSFGTEPIFTLLIKSSLFVILSIAILCMSISGSINLTRELSLYFTKTNTKFFDYIIDDKGIQLIINGNSFLYYWTQIDHIESDDTYFYFSCGEKHSIIDKKTISSTNLERIEKLIDENYSK